MRHSTSQKELFSETKYGVATLTTRKLEELSREVNPELANKHMTLSERMENVPLDSEAKRAFKKWTRVRNQFMHKQIDDYDKDELILSLIHISEPTRPY